MTEKQRYLRKLELSSMIKLLALATRTMSEKRGNASTVTPYNGGLLPAMTVK